MANNNCNDMAWPEETAGDVRAAYIPLRLLGEGGMGRVWLAKVRGSEELVAVKLPTDPSGLLSGEYERQALFNHPNILGIRRFVQEKRHSYLVMEWANVGDLGRTRPADGTQIALEVCSQIASALEAAHGEHIVHRDVKPGNILVQQDASGERRYLLSDFGVAAQDLSTTKQNLVGTVQYMAPEAGDAMGPASDIYSLGTVVHELLTGHLPHPGTPKHHGLSAWHTRRTVEPQAASPADVDPAFWQLVCEMVNPAPRKRPTAGQVRATCLALQSPHPPEEDEPSAWSRVRAGAEHSAGRGPFPHGTRGWQRYRSQRPRRARPSRASCEPNLDESVPLDRPTIARGGPLDRPTIARGGPLDRPTIARGGPALTPGRRSRAFALVGRARRHIRATLIAAAICALLLAVIVWRLPRATGGVWTAPADLPRFDPPRSFARTGTELKEIATGYLPAGCTAEQPGPPALLHENRVYAAGHQELTVLDASSGTLIKRARTALPLASQPWTSIRQPLRISDDDQIHIVAPYIVAKTDTAGSQEIELLGLEVTSDPDEWHVSVPIPQSRSGATSATIVKAVTHAQGVVFVDFDTSGEHSTIAIDVRTRTVLWSRSGLRPCGVVAGSLIAAATEMGSSQPATELIALSPRDPDIIKWRVHVDGQRPTIVTIPSDDTPSVFVWPHTPENVSSGMRIDARSGGRQELRSRMPGGALCRFDALATVVCWDGSRAASWAAAFNAMTGEQLWERDAQESLTVGTVWKGVVYGRTAEGPAVFDVRDLRVRDQHAEVTPVIVNPLVGLAGGGFDPSQQASGEQTLVTAHPATG